MRRDCQDHLPSTEQLVPIAGSADLLVAHVVVILWLTACLLALGWSSSELERSPVPKVHQQNPYHHQ